MYSGLECIRIAANNRIMIAYRLFSPNCPNFISGNHRIQTLQLTKQVIDNQVGLCYEGGSIYNDNTFITQPTCALEFYTLYGTKYQGFTFSMVHRILFYLSYLFSYRLLKKVYIYTLCINSS